MASVDPDDAEVLAHRIRTAVRDEMALNLRDVLFRRTRLVETGAFLGPGGQSVAPGPRPLRPPSAFRWRRGTPARRPHVDPSSAHPCRAHPPTGRSWPSSRDMSGHLVFLVQIPDSGRGRCAGFRCRRAAAVSRCDANLRRSNGRSDSQDHESIAEVVRHRYPINVLPWPESQVTMTRHVCFRVLSPCSLEPGRSLQPSTRRSARPRASSLARSTGLAFVPARPTVADFAEAVGRGRNA